MRVMSVKAALAAQAPQDAARVQGWVRTKREGKGFAFLEVNDGSCLKNLQVVVDEGVAAPEVLAQAGTGAAVQVDGALVESPGKGQKWEMKAAGLAVIGGADQEAYPLQKKRHSDEFLRTIAHLRPRTNKFGALFRIRSELSFAVHEFFRERGFLHIHSPILTGSDCEGAGELFRVTTQGRGAAARAEDDFFGQDTYLTVSGQLSAEAFAQSLGKVYTFGPTFRAENSNTPRHAAEFWMIEPEAAFADLADNMDLAEALLKHLVAVVRERCAEDLDLFARFVDPQLAARLDSITARPFARMSYTEAVEVLVRAQAEGKARFEYPVQWGLDLQTEHERYLAEVHCQRPVAVYDYPKSIKPFYMRVNDDGKTVAAMDVLAPGVGEIVGGSQREERLEVMLARMAELGMEEAPYWWYLDLRRFGTAPHAGFGLGFERLLMFLTGVSNIRDAIPFPRTPRSLEF
ncbi:MAG: asparagine--tRNA ligase [Thermodesulfobacteriota bacterium]